MHGQLFLQGRAVIFNRKKITTILVLRYGESLYNYIFLHSTAMSNKWADFQSVVNASELEHVFFFIYDDLKAETVNCSLKVKNLCKYNS